jgi:hypothetical protein
MGATFMNTQSLFRVLAAAGLSFAVTACGPQEELSSPELNPVSVESRLDSPRLSPDEARAAATSEGGTTDEVLGITYVRPGGVRPAVMAYEVPVTTTDSEGRTMQELVYVDANDGSVLLRVPLE